MPFRLRFRRTCLLLVIFLSFPLLQVEAMQFGGGRTQKIGAARPAARPIGEAPKPQLLNADSNPTLRYPVAVLESTVSRGWLDVTRTGVSYTVVESGRQGRAPSGKRFFPGDAHYLVAPAEAAGSEEFDVSLSEMKANGLKGNALMIAFSNRTPQLIYLPQEQWGTVEKPRQFQAAGALNLAGTMAIQRAMQNFGGALAELKPPAGALLDVTLRAEPTSVVRGRPVTLVWTSSNATSLDLEPGVGRVAAAGGTSLVPQDSTNYTLTAAGPAGTRAASVLVTVTEPPPPPAPTIVLMEPSAASEGQTVDVASSPLTIRGVVMDASGIPVVTINGRSVTMRPTSAQAAQFQSDPLDLQPGENRFEVVAVNGAHGQAKVVFIARLAPSAPTAPAAQPAGPNNLRGLAKAEIISLLQGDVPSARVAGLVQERGIKFVPTPDDLREIVTAGGGDDLINAINQASRPAKN
ncbi:MAG: hypothetical protein WAO35_03910 [Terriglobia bacterium]